MPFLLRHGKRLEKRFTEVKVQFRTPPIMLADNAVRDGEVCALRPNILTLSIQPREDPVALLQREGPGRRHGHGPGPALLDYHDRFGAPTTPAYERLLLDAILGDPTLFLRADEVEAAWRFADAVRASWNAAAAPPMLDYAPGGWGPAQAEGLFHGCEGGWSRG